MKDILITTLGTTWQILPEILGFISPDLVDLFRHHPEARAMAAARRKYGLQSVGELWVITTGGTSIEGAIEKSIEWYGLLEGEKPFLRIWTVAGTDSLTTEAECRRMSEAIHLIVRHGADQCRGGGSLVLSLAGGRKTMSTDLQKAASWFGCNCLIHVADDTLKGKNLKTAEWPPSKFMKPLAPPEADLYTPFVVGRFHPDPLSRLLSGAAARPAEESGILIFSEQVMPVTIQVRDDFPLTGLIEKQQAEAGFLMSNYSNMMLKGEGSTNFLALYSLPERLIYRLKEWKLGADPSMAAGEVAILRALPKAELHCHLGGVADAQDLVRIAGAAKGDIVPYRQLLEPWLADLQPLVGRRDINAIRKKIQTLKGVRTAVPGIPESICNAAFVLLFEEDIQLLDRLIYQDLQEPARFVRIGFDPYEALGDLQGSGLLNNEKCLREACHALARKAVACNVRYLEVRCSPANYTGGGFGIMDVYTAIAGVFGSYYPGLHTSLIIIASRHGSAEVIRQHIDLARQVLDMPSVDSMAPLRGIDLAGNEKAGSAYDIQGLLMPMMERCLHVTIHAGETLPAKSVWEAVYILNAERIGHGLTLQEHPELMDKFKDRGIAIEMCPSSNVQIRGFRDSFIPETGGFPEYPLKHYLDHGLRVTINTDNPGISRTDPALELHRACRLTPGGLSMWEILTIIRNGFKASFALRDRRQEVLMQAEEEIIASLKSILGNEFGER